MNTKDDHTIPTPLTDAAASSTRFTPLIDLCASLERKVAVLERHPVVGLLCNEPWQRMRCERDELRCKLEEVTKDRDNLKACWDYSIAERVRLQKSTAKDRGEARTALQDLQRLKNEVQAAMNRHSSQLSDILRGVGKEVAE